MEKFGAPTAGGLPNFNGQFKIYVTRYSYVRNFFVLLSHVSSEIKPNQKYFNQTYPNIF